jgi:hypothetical protein
VREQGKDENGRTMGFVNFGPVDFVKYEGSQPMNTTWKLKHPMPCQHICGMRQLSWRLADY